MSFASLKKSSGNFKQLAEALEKQSSPQSNNKTEDRFWKPEVDKAGNGYAVIRFLPAPEGEDLPWVRVFDHGFQGPGGWYIENSLTTLGQQDPVSEYNSKLWNSGVEANKEVARKQKRRLKYIANIVVVSDPKNPDNEGQVFLYQFGKKIFDKITEAMNPAFEDETPINPFDFWEGANFKLKIRQVEGYRNYDKSEFDSSTQLLSGDDDALEALWKTQHSLQEFVKPDNFKTYDELKARLDKVLGISTAAGLNATKEVSEEQDFKPAFKSAPQQAAATTAPTAEDVSVSSDDDDTLSYFAQLAEED
jgi:hypothetical protein